MFYHTRNSPSSNLAAFGYSTIMPNWQAYEAGLRQRSSLTMWFTEEAIAARRMAAWTMPGDQACYLDLAIATSLILRAVFHQPLCQIEGLVGCLLGLISPNGE